jgi:pimeloyl-ACP methyl ester carboxylesterase
VSFADNTLKWEMSQLRASYEGKLNAAGNEITGTFTQGMGLPLTLKRLDAAAAAGPNRPQEPKPPFPYKAEEVTFPSKASGVTLAGTLTVPPGEGPHPAVILISGSGPQNRDEALMGHKPFWVLADHLSRRGIAVLRYDDRGTAHSTGNFAAATSADFALDAEGALDFLKTRPGIESRKIGFAGHSEGGIIAPMVAARRADVAFVVLLAGTAVPGADVILEQGQAMARAAGASEEQLKTARQKQLEFYRILNATPDPAERDKRLRELLAGAPNAEAQIRSVSSPWFRYFLTYDPAPTLAKVKCPLLALNGEKDLQVLPDQNLPVLKAAIEKAANKDVTILRLPGLNHLFQAAKTGAVTEYAQIEETMNPAALDAVSSWLRKHTGLEK